MKMILRVSLLKQLLLYSKTKWKICIETETFPPTFRNRHWRSYKHVLTVHTVDSRNCQTASSIQQDVQFMRKNDRNSALFYKLWCFLNPTCCAAEPVILTDRGTPLTFKA